MGMTLLILLVRKNNPGQSLSWTTINTYVRHCQCKMKTGRAKAAERGVGGRSIDPGVQEVKDALAPWNLTMQDAWKANSSNIGQNLPDFPDKIDTAPNQWPSVEALATTKYWTVLENNALSMTRSRRMSRVHFHKD